MFLQIKDINISNNIFVLMPGSCIRGGTWDGSQIIIFSKHGHVAYQIEGDDKRNRIQVNLSP